MTRLPLSRSEGAASGRRGCIPAKLFRGDVLEGDFPCLQGGSRTGSVRRLPELAPVAWDTVPSMMLGGVQGSASSISSRLLLAFEAAARRAPRISWTRPRSSFCIRRVRTGRSTSPRSYGWPIGYQACSTTQGSRAQILGGSVEGHLACQGAPLRAPPGLPVPRDDRPVIEPAPKRGYVFAGAALLTAAGLVGALWLGSWAFDDTEPDPARGPARAAAREEAAPRSRGARPRGRRNAPRRPRRHGVGARRGGRSLRGSPAGRGGPDRAGAGLVPACSAPPTCSTSSTSTPTG